VGVFATWCDYGGGGPIGGTGGTWWALGGLTGEKGGGVSPRGDVGGGAGHGRVGWKKGCQ